MDIIWNKTTKEEEKVNMIDETKLIEEIEKEIDG